MLRLWIGVLFLWGASVLQAEIPLHIEIVSGAKSIQPGKPFHLALSLVHGRGYHTYWKHPGIVGVPTSIKWGEVPKGFRMGDVQWPEPERTCMFKIKAQGYDRDVVLPMLVTPPQDLIPGSAVTFKGLAAWMCCADSCHPGFANLEITLPVSAEPAEPSRWQRMIDKELGRRVEETSAWKTEVQLGKMAAVVTVKPQGGARPLKPRDVEKLIYFTEDGVIDTDKPQVMELQPDGSLVIRLVRADAVAGGFSGRLSGVLVRDGGWQADGKVRAMRVR
jgi:thiol:disulfide interchange protein DsbD